MSDVAKLLTAIGNAHKSGQLDQSQHDQLLTLASNKNEKALTLLAQVDQTSEVFAEHAIQLLKQLESNHSGDEKKLRPSGPSGRKPRALGINMTAVNSGNQTKEALEQDEEQTQNDAQLKVKSLSGKKERKTMPEKLQIDPSKLNKEAAPAKN